MYPSRRWGRCVVDLRRTGVIAALVAVATLGVPAGIRAAPIPFPDEELSYELQGETLKDFLQRLFDDAGIPVNVSAQLQAEGGSLNGPRSGTAAAVFKSIADSNGLVAYYDGSVAYVYKKREISSRYFQIDPARSEAFREATLGFGLTDANDTLQIKAATGVVAASGTPRFLEQVAQLSSALIRRTRAPSTPQQSRMTLRFFDLKYAWAADTTYTIGNQKTVIPGVATILKQLIGQQDGFGSQGGSGAPSG